MIGVHQTLFGVAAGDPREPGNCTQAAVASLLELPLDDVPHFVGLTIGDPRPGAWFPVLQSWSIDTFGFTWIFVPPDELAGVEWTCDPAELTFLGGGRSPRGPWGHSIVVDGRCELVWDPSPQGGGVAELWDVYVPVRPEPIALDRDGEPLYDIVRLPEAARR